MSQRGSKKEAGGVNEAKARVVRGKIRNETEFVAREYFAPLLRVNAPLFVKVPSLLASHCYSVLHNHFPTTSHFPRHLRRATHEWTRVAPFDGALPTTVSTLTTAILPYSTRRAPPPLYSRPASAHFP